MELRLEHSSESLPNPILYEYMKIDNGDQITKMAKNNESKQK